MAHIEVYGGELSPISIMVKDKPASPIKYDYKQVLVMRKDLNMRKGKLIAQGAHASLGVTLKNLEHPDVKAWLAGRFAKIAVYVNSEEELLDIYKNARDSGLLTELITDAGFTEFNNVPTNTCIAVGPGKIEEINKITGHLPLL